MKVVRRTEDFKKSKRSFVNFESIDNSKTHLKDVQTNCLYELPIVVFIPIIGHFKEGLQQIVQILRR